MPKRKSDGKEPEGEKEVVADSVAAEEPIQPTSSNSRGQCAKAIIVWQGKEYKCSDIMETTRRLPHNLHHKDKTKRKVFNTAYLDCKTVNPNVISFIQSRTSASEAEIIRWYSLRRAYDYENDDSNEAFSPKLYQAWLFFGVDLHEKRDLLALVASWAQITFQDADNQVRGFRVKYPFVLFNSFYIPVRDFLETIEAFSNFPDSFLMDGGESFDMLEREYTAYLFKKKTGFGWGEGRTRMSREEMGTWMVRRLEYGKEQLEKAKSLREDSQTKLQKLIALSVKVQEEGFQRIADWAGCTLDDVKDFFVFKNNAGDVGDQRVTDEDEPGPSNKSEIQVEQIIEQSNFRPELPDKEEEDGPTPMGMDEREEEQVIHWDGQKYNISAILNHRRRLPDHLEDVGEQNLAQLERSYCCCKTPTDHILFLLQANTGMTDTEINEWFYKRRKYDFEAEVPIKSCNPKIYQAWIFFGDYPFVEGLLGPVAHWARLSVKEARKHVNRLQKELPLCQFFSYIVPFRDFLENIDLFFGMPEELLIENRTVFDCMEEKFIGLHFKKLPDSTRDIAIETGLSIDMVNWWFSRFYEHLKVQKSLEVDSESRLRKLNHFLAVANKEKYLRTIANWAGCSQEHVKDFFRRHANVGIVEERAEEPGNHVQQVVDVLRQPNSAEHRHEEYHSVEDSGPDKDSDTEEDLTEQGDFPAQPDAQLEAGVQQEHAPAPVLENGDALPVRQKPDFILPEAQTNIEDVPAEKASSATDASIQDATPSQPKPSSEQNPMIQTPQQLHESLKKFYAMLERTGTAVMRKRGKKWELERIPFNNTPERYKTQRNAEASTTSDLTPSQTSSVSETGNQPAAVTQNQQASSSDAVQAAKPRKARPPPAAQKQRRLTAESASTLSASFSTTVKRSAAVPNRIAKKNRK